MEVDVFEDWGFRIVGEGEADVLEVDVAGDACGAGRGHRGGAVCFMAAVGPAVDLADDSDCLLDAFLSARLLLDTRLRGQQFANLDAGRVEALPIVDQPAGLAHGTINHPQVGVERHQVAEGHMACDDQESAESQGDELQGEAEAVEPWHVSAAVVGLVHIALHVVVVALVEFLGLVRLADERFDHAVAFDVLLDHRVHFRQGIADGKEQRPRMRGQSARQDEEEWRDAGERQGETPVDGEHHGERADEHDHAVERLIADPA